MERSYGEDDPNKLLGRPNGYTSKAACSPTRGWTDEADESQVEKDAIERVGAVEVFPDEAGAPAHPTASNRAERSVSSTTT